MDDRTGFLALPKSGERTLEALEKKLDLLVLQTLLLVEPERLTREARPYARVRRWLEGVAKGASRTALRRALSAVDVRAPVLALRSGSVAPDVALGLAVPSLLAAFAANLAPQARVDDVLWDVPFTRLVDSTREHALFLDEPSQGVFFDGRALEVRTAGGERVRLDGDGTPGLPDGARWERVCHRLFEGPRPTLSLVDGNPLAMYEEHPDKAGNALSLGERSVDEWLDSLREAFELIRVALPDLAHEISGSLQRIVPVGFEPEKHLSASYREAPGLIYMTLHPSALTMAEAVIHETQHGKLNVLRWFDPVLANADSTWTQSPVRPDLRPLGGVLLAVHAFVPVALFHVRLSELDHPVVRTPEFLRRRGEVISANESGLRTIRELGQITPIGREVMTALEELERAALERRPDSAQPVV